MKTFAEFGFNAGILEGLAELGFEEPTPVQEKVIPLMLERRVDLVGLAQTGTGKTAAFGLPLIQLTDVRDKSTQALVLCPTRELCVQVARDIQAFARHVHNLRTAAVYGGTGIENQIRVLRRGVHIIVATPGRLNDLLNRRKVDLSRLRYAVFDEADEMLQMGFQEELNAILAHTPESKNTLLFSATMSQEVAAIAARYMTDPVEITVGTRNAGAENVEHEYYLINPRDRYAALKRIVDNVPGNYSIVFCRTRRETQEVAAALVQDGYSADALHGDLTQGQRDHVMKKFRSRNLQILVATDVAARGLDVNDLTHVINYNLPDDISGYTHRSGRTGRAGRTGTSVAIVHPGERFRLRAIEKKIKKKFRQRSVPSGTEICRKQMMKLVETLLNIEVDQNQIEPLYAEMLREFGSIDNEELVKRFISMEFNRTLEYYRDAPDLNIKARSANRSSRRQSDRGRGKSSRRHDRSQKLARFIISAGRRQGVMPQGLIGTINRIPGVGRIRIGKIDIMRNRTVLEAEGRYASKILDAFRHTDINGRAAVIEILPPESVQKQHGRSSARRNRGRKYNAA